MKRVLATFLVFFIMQANTALAQDVTETTLAYGNQNQPGTRVHEAIQALIANGETLLTSSVLVINDSLSETSTLLSAKASQAVTTDKLNTIEFMRNMVTVNSLFEATKATIESSPENIINIINLTVGLYPDFAQEVINAAVMSGEMDSDQALLAAISAGADPTTVSEATAAGGPVALALAAPVGVGIGAGGTGGGDPTASTN
ncbi:MAG: hypothetical protein ACJAT7_003429 [Psychromonas sp.]|jgi:hypothetical protein|uniref:hypothetical protein n=1 Tax=Psychromonas sp. TaxID=1884585 RepID=UPI0039E2EF29